MKEYSYKDSGIEWLGEIPEHWKVDRIKDKTTNIIGGDWGDDPTSDKDGKVVIVLRVADLDDLYFSYDDPTYRKISDTSWKSRNIDDRTLLIEKSGGGEKQNVGRVGLPKDLSEEAICSNFMALIKLKKTVDKRFVNYTFSNLYNNDLNYPYVQQTTGIQNLNVGYYLTTKIPLPPLPEQKAIADYLDTACQKIDRVIELKEKQIEKIEKMNNSIITKAVFHGLDPNISYKIVNEQWLDRIPEHWRLRKLKRIFEGMDYGISESTSSEGTYPVLKMGNIVNGEIAYTKIEYVDSVSPDLILKNNDLLFNRTNSHDQVAKVGLFKKGKMDNVTFASYLVRLRCNQFSNPKYLNYALNTDLFLGLARKLAIPSVQQANLNPTRYGNIAVPVPPIKEQEEIVEYLDETVSKTKKLQVKVASQIDKLKNYSKSLIHECVTGKKRVYEGDIQNAEINTL